MMPPRQALPPKRRSISKNPNQLTPEIASHNRLQMMPVQIPHTIEEMMIFRVVCSIVSIICLDVNINDASDLHLRPTFQRECSGVVIHLLYDAGEGLVTTTFRECIGRKVGEVHLWSFVKIGEEFGHLLVKQRVVILAQINHVLCPPSRLFDSRTMPSQCRKRSKLRCPCLHRHPLSVEWLNVRKIYDVAITHDYKLRITNYELLTRITNYKLRPTRSQFYNSLIL